MDDLETRVPHTRIGAAVGLLLLTGLVLPLVDLPDRVLDLAILGIPRTVLLPAPWILGAVLAILVAVLSDSMVRAHPAGQGKGLGFAASLWPVPCIIALLTPPIVASLGFPWNWAPSLAGPFALAAMLLGQWHALSSRSAQWLLNTLELATCFALYWASLSLGLSHGRAAVALGAISAIISVELLHSASKSSVPTPDAIRSL